MYEIVKGKKIPVEIISQSETTDIINTIRRDRIFTVRFVKKDGSERVMNCRRGC